MSATDWLLIFDRDFLDDLAYRVFTDRRNAMKILELVEAVRRDPICGLGKPETLRHLGPAVWSRRITQEHRLVYRIKEDRILFAQCRHHY